MFTGIIEDLGIVIGSTSKTLTLKVPKAFQSLKIGASLAVSGACLSVIHKKGPELTFEVMPETFKKTNLGRLKKGAAVNLERGLKFGDRLDGHMVMGHIEGLGKVTTIKTVGNSRHLTLKIPKTLARYVVPKGWVALNGISLTVIAARGQTVTVGIIPITWRTTNLSSLKIGDPVNLETDMLIKAAEKLLK
jgi:riboflavin synthase